VEEGREIRFRGRLERKVEGGARDKAQTTGPGKKPDTEGESRGRYNAGKVKNGGGGVDQ